MEEGTQVKNEEVKQRDFKAMAKSAFNRAKLSRYLGLLFVLGATIVLSLWQVGWDPQRIGWQKFVANTSVLLFLGVYGLFFGEQEGGNLFKNIITGIYQTVRDKFLEIVDEIKRKAYVDSLPDYIVWRYEKDYQNTCHMKLLSVRVFDPSVCDLSDEQIEELKTKPIKISEDKHYSRLSEEQYNVVRAIKDGKIFVDYIDDYNFFLVEDDTNGKQLATRVKETSERKIKISWQQRISRIMMILLFAFVLAGFFFEVAQTIDPTTMTPEELAAAQKALKEAKIQAVKDLLSRVSCLVVSIASGFNTARLLNLEDVFVLKYKISYNTVFVGCMDNKTFKPVDVESKAKAEFEKYEKEQEEAKAKVVTPEIVKDEEQPALLENNSHLIEGGQNNGSTD